MFGIGSVPWFIAVVGGTALLGAAIAYAAWQWRHRDRRLDAVTEMVTRQNYAADAREEKGADATPDPSVTRRSRSV